MKFDFKFTQSNHSFDLKFGEVRTVTEYVGGELYDGEYEVIPKLEKQTLPTALKVMRNDVTIKEIPYFEVSNDSGGNTVYIGNEV